MWPLQEPRHQSMCLSSYKARRAEHKEEGGQRYYWGWRVVPFMRLQRPCCLLSSVQADSQQAVMPSISHLPQMMGFTPFASPPAQIPLPPSTRASMFQVNEAHDIYGS